MRFFIHLAWRAVACRQCRRLVIAPKLRHLWDSYLNRHTVTAIIETLSGARGYQDLK